MKPGSTCTQNRTTLKKKMTATTPNIDRSIDRSIDKTNASVRKINSDGSIDLIIRDEETSHKAKTERVMKCFSSCSQNITHEIDRSRASIGFEGSSTETLESLSKNASRSFPDIIRKMLDIDNLMSDTDSDDDDEHEDDISIIFSEDERDDHILRGALFEQDRSERSINSIDDLNRSKHEIKGVSNEEEEKLLEDGPDSDESHVKEREPKCQDLKSIPEGKEIRMTVLQMK